MDQSKKCKGECGLTLLLDEFSPKVRGLMARYAQCKKCRNSARAGRRQAESRDYYDRHKPTINARNLAYHHRDPLKAQQRKKRYYKANAPALRDYSSRYFADHAEDQLKKQKQKREQNPAKAHALNRRYSKDWRARNPERRRASVKANKAKRAMALGRCAPEQWLAKIEYWAWRCYLCGVDLTSETLHMEHRIPIARGGTHWPANLAPACESCNLSKGTKTEAEFRLAKAA